MIIFIIAGASFLSLAMGFTGILCILAEQISSMGLTPVMLIAVVFPGLATWLPMKMTQT